MQNINKQIAKAEKMIAGDRPVKKDRFVKFTSKTMVLDQALIDAARARAGINRIYDEGLTAAASATFGTAEKAVGRSEK